MGRQAQGIIGLKWGVATILPGLGASDRVPLLNRELDPSALELRPEDYFVLTRVDGRTTLKQLLLITGLPEAQGLEAVRRLYDVGAIYFAGEEPRRAPLLQPELASGPIVIDERLLTAADVDLTDAQKRSILHKHASLRSASYFSILGVPRDCDRRAVKEAYRRLSKEFHPDRFGRRRLGPFQNLLAEIFEHASAALETLSEPDRRDAYLASLAGRPPTPPQGRPTVVTEAARDRARELYQEACHHQVSGELDKALPEFAQAIALDPQPRWLRRAAEAALKAQELRLAEEYAKKGAELDPHNGMAHRILGKVLHALGRNREARDELAIAQRMDPENPHLAAELRALSEDGS
jgi:curved DNA-binding protein CbpA